MKVELIEARTNGGIEEKFNEFAKDQDIVSVQVTDLYDPDDGGYYCVTYHIFYNPRTQK